jgi:hypothetical protein
MKWGFPLSFATDAVPIPTYDSLIDRRFKRAYRVAAITFSIVVLIREGRRGTSPSIDFLSIRGIAVA